MGRSDQQSGAEQSPANNVDGARDTDVSDDDEELARPRVVSSPSDPLPNARQFVATNYAHDERDLLLHHGGSFEGWSGSCWPQVEDAALRAAVYTHFDGAFFLDAKGKSQPFRPTRDKVANVIDATKAVTHLDASVGAPAWLTPHDVPADEIIAMDNGLLHYPTRKLLACTPNFYTNWALPYAYDPMTASPTQWFEFLRQVFADDDQLTETLQEICGYLVSNDTRQQKIINFIGTKRGGKGTIARVLTGLLGAHNVAAPTLSSLSTEFGLEPLIGKPLATISDARLHASDEKIVERVLSISGQDSITIPRKHRGSWTGQLPTRFLFISNEIPRLRDASGALASRVLLVPFTRSFYGQEDPDLTAKLLAELPGILNWSLDGLERLRARGRFVQPASASEILREIEDLGSPISAFLRDRCIIGPAHSILIEALYAQWRDWCVEQGRDRPGDKHSFGKDLRAAVPGLRTERPREAGVQLRCYRGVGLKSNEGETR